jgi:hypothetical protein
MLAIGCVFMLCYVVLFHIRNTSAKAIKLPLSSCLRVPTP